MTRLVKYIFSLFVSFLVIFICIKVTTWGWHTSTTKNIHLTQGEEKSAQEMKSIVEKLSGSIGHRNYIHPENLEKSAEFIADRFRSLGYQVEFFPFQVSSQTFKNIIVKKPSDDPTLDLVIIGAHYDTCFNPGADDNASGIAGLIELARSLKDAKLKYNLQFIAFVNEEPPFFMTEDMGSRRYARWLRDQPFNVKGVIVLEMIGYFSERRFSQKYYPLLGMFYPTRGNFIALVSNISSRRFLQKVKRGFTEADKIPVESLWAPGFLPGINYSDHWSFWEEGWPAIMVTDTAFMRNPNYHQSSDIDSTLDYGKMALTVTALKQAVMGLEQ